MSKISPSHYSQLDPEPIDVMRSWLTTDQFAGYLKGSVIKYLSRAGYKEGESTLDDLEKARWFLDRWIQLEREGALDNLVRISEQAGGYSEIPSYEAMPKANESLR